jgi:hypothetical protein
VTYKTGFGLDELVTSSQSFVINNPVTLQPNPSFLTAEDSLHSNSDLILFCTAYIASRRTHRKYVHFLAVDYTVVAYCCRRYLATGCLPRICLRGKMFIEPLPSSRSLRHNIYKSVRTSQETHYVCTTKPNRLMVFRETVAVYWENHAEHMRTLCGQNTEIF